MFQCLKCKIELAETDDWALCNKCLNQYRFDRAEKFTKWYGPVFWPGYEMGLVKEGEPEDGFFPTVESMFEFYRAMYNTSPEWVYAVQYDVPRVDVETLEAIAAEDFGDERSVEYELEMIEKIRKWNAKQKKPIVSPDFSKVIILKSDDR